jgi:ABC-2 type transport system permease protein
MPLTSFEIAMGCRRGSQVIIYRGGGVRAVWVEFAMVAAIGLAFFVYSLRLFRKSIAVSK